MQSGTLMRTLIKDSVQGRVHLSKHVWIDTCTFLCAAKSMGNECKQLVKFQS